MTIEEVQERKSQTEDEIRKLLVEFVDATGLLVRGINLDAETVRPLAVNAKAAQLICNVELEVSLS